MIEQRKGHYRGLLKSKRRQREMWWCSPSIPLHLLTSSFTTQIAFCFGFFEKQQKNPFNFYGFAFLSLPAPNVFQHFKLRRKNRETTLRLIKCLIIIRNNRKIVGRSGRQRNASFMTEIKQHWMITARNDCVLLESNGRLWKIFLTKADGNFPPRKISNHEERWRKSSRSFNPKHHSNARRSF